MAWTRAWAALRRLGFSEAIIASCQFASIHKKEFVFLLPGLDAQRLQVKCPGGHRHVKIEGSLPRARPFTLGHLQCTLQRSLAGL